MSAATLTITPSALLPGARDIVVDCKHGQTVATLMLPPGVTVAEQAAVRAALAKHHSVEGCRCTKALRRRYLAA